MKQTQGRFLLQPNRDFPADCEMLDYIQTNAHIVSIIGNLAGDKAVLLGCEPLNETQRGEGYVFLRTKDHPEGEVLFWEGGSTSGGMYLKQETISVQAHGYDYPEAYVRRSLAAGVGSENYKWTDFHEARALPKLTAEIETLRTALANIKQSPIGTVEIWAGGDEIPENYALCDGRALRQGLNYALYSVLGDKYNEAPDCNGRPQTTSFGYFRLPDLRGRFIVGYNGTDSDYSSYGRAGGEKKHTLSAGEMPSHTHIFKDYYQNERLYGSGGIDGADKVDPSVGTYGASSDCKYLLYKEHNTSSSGNNLAHENRPPYYVLAYIMRIK